MKGFAALSMIGREHSGKASSDGAGFRVFCLRDVTAVREPIEYSTGQTLVVQNLNPLFERQVRGHDDAGPPVGLADDVEH